MNDLSALTMHLISTIGRRISLPASPDGCKRSMTRRDRDCALGRLGGRRVERADAGTRRAATLGQRAQRHDLDVEPSIAAAIERTNPSIRSRPPSRRRRCIGWTARRSCRARARPRSPAPAVRRTPPELAHALDHVQRPVHAGMAVGQATTVGVDRQSPARRDAGVYHEGNALALAAEAHVFQEQDRRDRVRVVEEGDVAGAELRRRRRPAVPRRSRP